MRLEAKFARILTGMAMLSLTPLGFASASSVVGLWKTFDKKNHKATSIIQIWEQAGKYYGKVAKIYSVNGAKPTDICVYCKGELRNKPMLGLPIIKHMILEKGKYQKGMILDPRNGKEYHCVMKVSKDGQTLHVRGYVGIPLFGQTDDWKRVEKD